MLSSPQRRVLAWVWVTATLFLLAVAAATAWLLAMGLGGLGLMGRRRREALPSFRDADGVEPLAATLRNSART